MEESSHQEDRGNVLNVQHQFLHLYLSEVYTQALTDNLSLLLVILIWNLWRNKISRDIGNLNSIINCFELHSRRQPTIYLITTEYTSLWSCYMLGPLKYDLMQSGSHWYLYLDEGFDFRRCDAKTHMIKFFLWKASICYLKQTFLQWVTWLERDRESHEKSQAKRMWLVFIVWNINPFSITQQLSEVLSWLWAKGAEIYRWEEVGNTLEGYYYVFIIYFLLCVHEDGYMCHIVVLSWKDIFQELFLFFYWGSETVTQVVKFEWLMSLPAESSHWPHWVVFLILSRKYGRIQNDRSSNKNPSVGHEILLLGC